MLLNLLGQNARFIGRARYFIWTRHHILTLRLSLIILCLVFTVTSALLLQTSKIIIGIIPILLVAGLAGFLFIYYNLQLTPLILVIVSTVLSMGIGTGTGTPITLTFILLVIAPLIWFIRMAAVERHFDILPLPANWPGLLFIITVVISSFWGGAFADNDVRFLFIDKINVRAMTGLTIIVSILAYFLFANYTRSLRSMKFMVYWYILAGGVMGAIFLMTGFVNLPMNPKGQLPAFVTILALGQVLFNQGIPRFLKLALIAICATWFYITYFLGITWLSGWVPTVIGAGILFALRSKKLLVLGVIFVAIYALSNTDFITNTLNIENKESGGTRTEAWNRVLDLTDDHLLFGTGPVGYHFYFTVDIGGLYQLSHNNYMDILAQTGVIGFAIFIWMWLAIGWTIWRVYRMVPREGFQYGLGMSLVATYAMTMFVMALGDWITPFPYTQSLAGIDYTIWHWMFAGLSGALYAHIKQNHPTQMSVAAPLTHDTQ